MLFTAEDAEKMMLRDESSVLRVIAIGTVLYSVSSLFSQDFVYLVATLGQMDQEQLWCVVQGNGGRRTANMR